MAKASKRSTIKVAIGDNFAKAGLNEGLAGEYNRKHIVERGRKLVGYSTSMDASANKVVHSRKIPLTYDRRKIEDALRARKPVVYFNQFQVGRICRDRRVRREVLFAKGKSGGSHKPPMYRLESFVRCR